MGDNDSDNREWTMTTMGDNGNNDDKDDNNSPSRFKCGRHMFFFLYFHYYFTTYMPAHRPLPVRGFIEYITHIM
jgi:hypothetical protein